MIRLLNGIIDTFILFLLIVLLLLGGYGLWDSHQIQSQAEADTYEIYKPTEADSRTFEDFQKANPDVWGWLNVYGTHIDYPLVRGEDNSEYLNTGPDGAYTLSGSLFLDYRNRRDLSDFNSIIYGHHMAGEVMFGEIGNFKEKSYFDDRRYGSIYCSGREYGLEFFAFLEVDAYESGIYTPALSGKEEREEYLELLKKEAMHYRETGVKAEDRIVLLSTCTSDSTNGRHILVGKLTDKAEENPFEEEKKEGIAAQFLTELSLQKTVILVAAMFVFLAVIIIVICRKKKSNR